MSYSCSHNSIYEAYYLESIRGVFHFFLKSVFKLYIIQKNFVPLQKIMAITGIFPERLGMCHAQTEWLCRT